MGIIKGFTFDGVDSLDYNIGITGSAVYNAPTRDVEMISIPGRDGEYALDHGRFNNIEITYPAGMYDTAQTDFATRISELRNQLASRVGYKRLEDEYNPDEYRMAIYKSGLEVSPVQYSRAGQFDIIFDCKPQRFLKSGETATSKARNSTINNPTLFDSHPLLQFNSNGSDGSISLGTQTITVKSAYVGTTPLDLSATPTTISGYVISDTVTINNTSVYNVGDPITFDGAEATFTFGFSNSNAKNVYWTSVLGFKSPTIQNTSRNATVTLTATDKPTFTAGSSRTETKTADIVVRTGLNQVLETKTITLEIIYNGSNTFTTRWTVPTFTNISLITSNNNSRYTGSVDSTKNALQNVTIYIDLDIGEAYSIDSSNNVVSLNNYVNIGGELATLPPGNTTITYSNSISNFKITPRWYKI